MKEDFQTNSSSWDIQGRRNVWNWIKTLVKQFVFSSRLQIRSWSLLVDSRSWKRGGENEVTSTETKGAGPPAVGDDGHHVSQQLLDRQQNRQNRSFWMRTHRPSERMERMKGGCPPAPLMCAGGAPAQPGSEQRDWRLEMCFAGWASVRRAFGIDPGWPEATLRLHSWPSASVPGDSQTTFD